MLSLLPFECKPIYVVSSSSAAIGKSEDLAGAGWRCQGRSSLNSSTWSREEFPQLYVHHPLLWSRQLVCARFTSGCFHWRALVPSLLWVFSFLRFVFFTLYCTGCSWWRMFREFWQKTVMVVNLSTGFWTQLRSQWYARNLAAESECFQARWCSKLITE